MANLAPHGNTQFVLENFAKRVLQAIVTGIAKDGFLKEPTTELYGSILESLPNLRLIASGGASVLGDIAKLERCG